MNFKRKKLKSSRGGCLLCKPWKHQDVKKTKSAKKINERKADQNFKEQLKETYGI